MADFKHWCGNCQIRVYVQRHYGKTLTWADCPYTCEYAIAMRCSTECGNETEQEWVVNRMTEDITFCQNGWEECQVTRCERHPSNIENPQLPHSYAKLYRTEYCPLEKPQPVDTVEVVRCKDCKHWIPYDWMFSEVWKSQNIDDYAESEIGCTYCDMSMGAMDYCSRGERKNG